MRRHILMETAGVFKYSIDKIDIPHLRDKEVILRYCTLILLLMEIALSGGCTEVNPEPGPTPTMRSKPSPPADALITPHRGPAPARATRGLRAVSPSTGEPVEVHRSR